ncbi:MAG: Asp-tRNA(Asn)/Glu-tRNA(Gln) amidotransferase subunit GatB [Pseudodesulfovibrio sp.]|uniref:Aspartyl/glutamyl-tRNA(Asn/Gln) amidotransferase subunit B n=1 Tax=Pseudodesulfovibrio aespoeensis (strain ATCC 700646 / DSM 10631 / Aspo-2) TaxID=643562 RepID=E6VS85_PSEA9|nr:MULTISPECIES: Asp-tRNA(Asn)/Glu-tRNA(Gln) amidotransferase subunit GatB [Pseudodesulfovibrio]MBU4245074.1 Asp-tRNA(Asn)/Glu-tRNA(Gln) amidotransferase subunit GatB [Pseudomonadota bacterium]ADU63130.1 glutamyl-tRNA(Gln) amidotransferase, B subunit [Pseudodesulfovibrio aespoeensis Aspo-2]MBU4379567.1 Asp-tRNA(Asn)/Glu-tRNA(Gln) amidotransferase subunit GatB [Pseudomonadota bacterium]MBU4475066.1 Asp-tRNA(Asn)/Glu-tRNA(Gln) amidotransferase subunit GatB [Pseudomonadota bacterium]MBU4516840.1 
MPRYETVIGLEVHAHLKTRSKIFCSCSTTFGREPNENVCAVCSGMPGVLPVLNAKVPEFAAKMGLATGCEVNLTSVFARKNYFYPDLPKGYQISQFELPICERGQVAIEVDGQRKVIGLTRIHMEEDAGKNIHSAAENASFVDLNRAGVPLIEIVSEPDMRSAEEAVAYLKELRSILLYLGICDGNMEEGSFRCDANVSIRPAGQETLGTRAELKNLNSFKHVQKAIEYEVARQIDLIEDGEAVVQETRLYNADKGTTHSMRGKEEAHDYRYFPDPDLVPLVLDPAWVEQWRAELPELPAAKRARFMADYGLADYDADLLTGELAVADYYEAAVRAYSGEARKVANWVVGDLLPSLGETGIAAGDCRLTPARLAGLLALVDDGTISVKIGKDSFRDLCASGDDPAEYVRDRGLAQVSDTGELEAMVDRVIAENPSEAEAYRGGKIKLISFFMGQVMRLSKGQANPGVVTKLLQQKLS